MSINSAVLLDILSYPKEFVSAVDELVSVFKAPLVDSPPSLGTTVSHRYLDITLTKCIKAETGEKNKI